MSRIKLTLGNLHIEYEGEQEFIESSLLTLASGLLELAERVPAVESVPGTAAQKSKIDLSTNTIAGIISVKTGSDLALAAIARINIVKGQPTAARQEILDEMREASTYFRDGYAGNLSSYLDTLVKGRKVNLASKGNYALSASERARLEGVITADA
jgi:hypothetical protein